jgi:phosphomannomutase
MTSLDPGIFKAYDIRGLYGSQIDGDAAEAIGRAFAQVLSGLAGKPVGELRARTCSTRGRWARRCCITSSVRASSTGA